MVQDARILAQHLLARIAGRPQERVVHVLDAGFGVGDDDGLGALLDGGGQASKVNIPLLQLAGHVVDALFHGMEFSHR